MDIPRGKIITVERSTMGKGRAGQGLLKAMGVVWQHWQASFRKNERFDQIHGTFTQEYPEERPKLPESYRNMPVLLYDDGSGHELCTSCFQCQRICPPQVIHMTQAKDPATGKAVPALAAFIIEYDACMSCGFCAEVCPFDAIKMDHAFELATDDQVGLTVHKEQLNRPVSYYQRIAPKLWAEVEASANKKLLGNIKRRPGSMGIAPGVGAVGSTASVASISATETTVATETERPSVAAVLQAPETLQAVPAEPATPAAPAEPAATDDKAAKLAAIRAANAARKAAGAAPAAEPGAPIEPVAPAAPAEPAATDDKAAKLAAIRAANAARKAASAAPAAEPGAPIVGTEPSQEQGP